MNKLTKTQVLQHEEDKDEKSDKFDVQSPRKRVKTTIRNNYNKRQVKNNTNTIMAHHNNTSDIMNKSISPETYAAVCPLSTGGIILVESAKFGFRKSSTTDRIDRETLLTNSMDTFNINTPPQCSNSNANSNNANNSEPSPDSRNETTSSSSSTNSSSQSGHLLNSSKIIKIHQAELDGRFKLIDYIGCGSFGVVYSVSGIYYIIIL